MGVGGGSGYRSEDSTGLSCTGWGLGTSREGGVSESGSRSKRGSESVGRAVEGEWSNGRDERFRFLDSSGDETGLVLSGTGLAGGGEFDDGGGGGGFEGSGRGFV